MQYRQVIQGIQAEHGRQIDMRDLKFLELLLENKNVSQEKLPMFLEEMHKRSQGSKELALSLAIIDEGRATDYLAQQFGEDRRKPEQVQIDLGFARSMDQTIVSQVHALPVATDTIKDRVTVFTDRPNNSRARQALAATLGTDPQKIDMILCSPSEFKELRRRINEDQVSDSPDAGEQRDVSAGETQDDLKARRLVENMILEGQQRRASDIHFQPGAKRMDIRMRIDGLLYPVDSVPAKLQSNIASVIKNMAGLDQAETIRSQDGHIMRDFGRGQIDVRVATVANQYGEDVELRLLDPETRRMTIGELGMTPRAQGLVEEGLAYPDGLIVVSGATGAGKTTTLYACMEILNSPEYKLYTIESPIELKIEGVSQIEITSTSKKRGVDFADATESILRNDPDIIMVGEIRKKEEALAALQAADTGHLVLTSLHARSASGVVNRLLERGVEAPQLAHSLLMITHQRLVRKLCVYCRIDTDYSSDELRDAGAPKFVLEQAEENGGKIQLKKANNRGCDKCLRGYHKRIGIHEIVLLTPEMRALISEGGSSLSLDRLIVESGQPSLEDDFYVKVLEGITGLDERRHLSRYHQE